MKYISRFDFVLQEDADGKRNYIKKGSEFTVDSFNHFEVALKTRKENYINELSDDLSVEFIGCDGLIRVRVMPDILSMNFIKVQGCEWVETGFHPLTRSLDDIKRIVELEEALLECASSDTRLEAGKIASEVLDKGGV